MRLAEARQAWETDGLVVLPAYLRADELSPALEELGSCFPSAEGFHDRTDTRAERFIGDEFAGIDTFPFASTALSLLAVHQRIQELVQALVGTDDIRAHSAEAWAKFTGAADYDQHLHRDYLNHTILGPNSTPAFQQVELFLYLVDVPEDLGPPHMVPQRAHGELPARPNWFPRTDGVSSDGGWVSTAGRADLYAAEISAAGPAGTVVAFSPGTLHRGTALTRRRGARYTMHLGYRPTSAEWGQRSGWPDHSHEASWYRFVSAASPRQLQLFGFPPPGHPYWTANTLAEVAERYPHLDLAPWLHSATAAP